MHRPNARMVLGIALSLAVVLVALAGTAQAKLTGEFVKFANCPYTNLEVRKCLYSPTEGGEVVLGKKKVPIVKPAVLQGGFGKPVEKVSKFYPPTNGTPTLSEAPQPVPGGLAGLVNCKEISNLIFRATCELTFENGLTGVNSILELARPASEIQIAEVRLAEKVGTAVRLPVKVRLENPLLGPECYVGSESSPIIWELTTGKTAPPAPNESIEGTPGELELFEEGSVLQLKNAVLVDNAWEAPGAGEGCGGIFSFILDPIIDVSAGLPAKAGQNTAILKNTINIAAAVSLRINDEENP